MGCGASSEKAEKARNDEIEKQLKADKTRLRNEVKLLLLGMSSFHNRHEQKKKPRRGVP